MTHAVALLAESIRADGVNLLLGAGVSVPAGLPSWEKLTQLMIDRTWPASPSTYDIRNQVTAGVVRNAGPVEAMRLVRQKLGTDFLGELRTILYAGYKTASPLLQAIARLQSVRFVCTYNFDDLLEQVLATDKRQFMILTPGDRLPPESRSDPLAIAHPHGLLPMFSDARQVPHAVWSAYVERILNKATGDVVITEDDYHELYRDFLGWSNLVQLKALLARPRSLSIGMRQSGLQFSE